MKKFFVVICKADNISYMNVDSETLFHSPLYEHVYRKFSDAVKLSGIDANIVRCATYQIPTASEEIVAGIDDIVAFVSPFAFLSKIDDVISAIKYVNSTELGYAKLGSLRSLYATIGTGKMLSDKVVSSTYDFISLIENCGAECFPKSFAEEEIAFPDTKHEYIKRVEEYRKEFLYTLSLFGVKIDCFDGVTVSPNSHLERGSVILCGSVIKNKSYIGEDAVIGPSSTVDNSTVCDECRVISSFVSDSTLEKNVYIGPYCNVRSSSHILSDSRIESHSDICNCDIGAGVVVRPQCSLIEADIGSRVNVGSSVVTVNYDGKASLKCKISDDAFIGSNASLIAPVEIGLGAFVAAGSTITDNVPAGALSIAREYQSNHEGWARRRSKGNN